MRNSTLRLIKATFCSAQTVSDVVSDSIYIVNMCKIFMHHNAKNIQAHIENQWCSILRFQSHGMAALIAIRQLDCPTAHVFHSRLSGSVASCDIF